MIKKGLAFLLLIGLWLILTEGRLEALGFGVVVALLGVWIMPPLGRWHLGAALGFAGWFLLQSVKSGTDVALRALHPKLPLFPGQLSYNCDHLPSMGKRFFVACISLLPGTLSVHYDGQRILVHVLDRHQDNHAALDQLAEQIARLFKNTPKPKP